jgi:transcriptional regulator with XRE-family HTH domain
MLDGFIAREGLTASALARQAEIATPYIFELITGRSTPRADTLRRLAHAASELLKRDVSVEELWDFGRPPLPPLGKFDRNIYRSESASTNSGGLTGDPALLHAELLRMERRFANVDLKLLNPAAAVRWASEFEGMNDLRSALALPTVDYSKPGWARHRAK